MRVAFESDSLVRIRNMIARLRSEFHAAGLLEQAQGEDVKFHVTVLNRKRDVETRRSTKLDVTRLIGDNRATLFGTSKLHEVHLARRHSRTPRAARMCRRARSVLP
jgi:hypothetical protein